MKDYIIYFPIVVALPTFVAAILYYYKRVKLLRIQGEEKIISLSNATIAMQGKILDLWNIAEREHNKLRHLTDYNEIDITKCKKQLDVLQEVIKVGCHIVLLMCGNSIKGLFEQKSNDRLGISVKILKEDEVTSNYIHFVCDYPADYPIRLNRNTAFRYVKETGNYFLVNDVPNAVASGKFEEEEYKYKDKKYLFKSTLVIPLTLRNYMLSDNFMKMFHIQHFKEEKDIFGFLCLDHPDVGFFNVQDVEISHIFAQFITFALLIEMQHTKFSEVYQHATETLYKDRPGDANKEEKRL